MTGERTGSGSTRNPGWALAAGGGTGLVVRADALATLRHFSAVLAPLTSRHG